MSKPASKTLESLKSILLPCPHYARFSSTQKRIVVQLVRKYTKYTLDGNEYYAHQVRQDLIAATSPARLIHTLPKVTYSGLNK